jgi:hypothetical protein
MILLFMIRLPILNSITMSGSTLITKVIDGFCGADRLARYRQIEISVIGRKTGQVFSNPVWFVAEDVNPLPGKLASVLVSRVNSLAVGASFLPHSL